MPEEYIVRNCAPTLAGIKTGSLFTCPFETRDVLFDGIRRINKRLTGRGLRLIPLRVSGDRALLYLYRPEKLRSDLTQGLCAQLLRCRGYNTDSCEGCVAQLGKRLRRQEAFPHEIGLFLGYPPEDVLGFIEQGPDRCKCTGCWKVYGDEESARKKFSQYRQCTRIYRDRWEKEKDIERLIVAG